ncbi:MAG: glycosyltransferase [bacterium]|nr:glycosyltransferase [bacterium]
MTPAVSVVLATHDGGRWLDETIASVRAQTRPDWELLVIDDGSTDDTPTIVARHAAADARVRHLPGPRLERAGARNRGVAAARAPWLAFLDADDTWLPAKLERQLAALERVPGAALCWTRARFVDAAGRPLPEHKPPRPLAGDAFAELARGNVLILASVVAPRALVEALAGFDATLPVLGCEDWDLWLRLARGRAVVGVDEDLVCYRIHDANTPRARVLASALAVIDKHWADPTTARAAGIGRAAVRARHLWWAAAAEPARGAGRGWRRGRCASIRAAPSATAALAAWAALVLPAPLVRALRRRAAG